MNEQLQQRMVTYSLLARLFLAPVDQNLLHNLQAISVEQQYEDPLSQAWLQLSSVSAEADVDLLDDEFQRLFIGLGRGELLPFCSFYETGFLMEKPLVRLRADLKQLGYQRQHGNKQPEDHISAISEVMGLLISDESDAQREFFQRHLQPWFGRFFVDLEAAARNPFYQAVAVLGCSFMDKEAKFFR